VICLIVRTIQNHWILKKSMHITLSAVKNNNITSGGENDELNDINFLLPVFSTEKIRGANFNSGILNVRRICLISIY
jgi:hypothetical protein